MKHYNAIERVLRFVVFGLLNIIGFIAKIGSIPFHWLSEHIHRVVDDHPLMQHKHARMYISACIRALVIGLVVWAEHSLLSHGNVWAKWGTETAKAGAACPIWEVIGISLFRRG